MLDQTAIDTAGDDELVNLPIHETREPGTGRRDSLYLRSIRTTARAAKCLGQLFIETVRSPVSQIARTCDWQWAWFDPVVAGWAAVLFFGQLMLASRTRHRAFLVVSSFLIVRGEDASIAEISCKFHEK